MDLNYEHQRAIDNASPEPAGSLDSPLGLEQDKFLIRTDVDRMAVIDNLVSEEELVDVGLEVVAMLADYDESNIATRIASVALTPWQKQVFDRLNALAGKMAAARERGVDKAARA